MYEINGSVINGHAINGPEVAGSFTATGAGSLFTVEQAVQRTESGSLFTLEQTVARVGAGSLFTIEQAVVLHVVGSGSLFTVEQSVEAVASGSLFTIEQRVVEPTQFTNLQRFGWDLALYINGDEVPPDEITGEITVTRAENSAALMDVTLKPKQGVQDFESYHGKTIVLDIIRPNRTDRLYTGVIDIPDVDLILKRVALSCTDRRNEQINEQLGSQLKFIGEFSGAIFETPEDVAEELESRLLTTTKTVDFDAYGNYTVADFLPKSTPDFVLADADIYRRTPQVKIASRGRLINRVNVEFEWRYVRLRHRERTFKLFGATFCDVMTTPGLQFLAVDGIKSNIESMNWPLKPSTTSFEYLPASGWYNCGQGKFLWATSTATGTTSVVRDENGDVVTDANGNPVTENNISNVTDYRFNFATEATWIGAKRFAQDISEKINIQVSAPQSINQYGVIEKTQRHGKQVEYDSTDFEREEAYVSPTDFVATAGDHYLDKSGDYAEYRDAILTTLNMAVTKIEKSHRDNHVTIQTPIWPEVDLKHTVQTTAGVIQAKGKVSEISHRLDIGNRFAETETRFSLSRAQGSQSNGSLSIPILNAPLVGEEPTGPLKMYTYLGGELGGAAISFGDSVEKSEGIITPSIDDESRNKQEVESSYSLDIAVRNDPLTVTF